MTERKREQPPEVASKADGDEITRIEAEGAGDVEHRRKAASSLLSPAIAPAGEGPMLEADARLDNRSETVEALERARETPD